MVAITVILAAVIGTFVLGLSDQVGDTPPRASFDISQEQTTYTGPDGGDTGTDPDTSTITEVTITHESGDTIAMSNIQMKVDGQTAYGLDNNGDASDPTSKALWDGSGDVGAGQSVTVSFYDNDPTNSPDYSAGQALDVSGSPWSDTYASELQSGDTVQVIYQSPDSKSSTTLKKYEVE